MEKHINPLVVLIPQQYVSALLSLHEKFEAKKIEWVISGDLGEALKRVKVQPDCIEILTSKDGAEQIYESVKELSPQPIALRVQKSPRNALIGGIEYPIFMKSCYFEFQINGIKVKVDGDLQYKVGDWDWGDKFEFNPDTVYIVNKRTSIVPLQIKYELYQSLGWTDRIEKIRQASQKPFCLISKEAKS